MTDAAIARMNSKLKSVQTARFCALQAMDTGDRLAIVSHTFEGKADPSAALVVMGKDGKILTPLDGLSSAKEIGFRTPMVRAVRVFAGLTKLCKQTDEGRAPTQMIEVTAADATSHEALKLMNPLPAWSESVFENGFLMGKEGKGDPRKKTTDAKRKLSKKAFNEWFQEIIESQGAPYASAWTKFNDGGTVTFRSKILQRVWDTMESADSEYDDVTPRVEDVKKTSVHRTKLEPIKVYYDNAVVKPEDYTDVISCADLCYITGTMKLVHSR